MAKRRRRSRNSTQTRQNGNLSNSNGVTNEANGENKNEEENVPYIVESPDEDENPKKAKIPKKGDKKDKNGDKESDDGNDFKNSDDDWSALSLEERINKAFAGGVFYDGSSDSDDYTEVEFSVEESNDEQTESESADDEEKKSDDANEEDEDSDEGTDLEFNEDQLYESDSDNAMLFGELDGMGLEMEGASNQEPNSDEEIENVIASIRPKDEDGVDSESEKSKAETEESDAEKEVVGPVDDLEELASGDEADLYEDDEEAEDDDGFIIDENDIEMLSTEDEMEEDSDEDDDDDIDEDDDEGEEETGIPASVSEQFKAHDKTECIIEGYRTVSDNGLLLSLDRTSASKSRSGAFRPFKFTEKKLADIHSVEVAEDAFSWIVGPVDYLFFYKYTFQRGVYHVSRRDSNYFKGLFSSHALVQIVQKHDLRYGENINVATYTKDEGRKTFNPEGKVFAHQLKKFIKQGCSIQCINPQSFSGEIWYLCEILQEHTHSFVGANTYLTPANSSGFAPHWDEVDAFILQIEGRKYWRVWAPDDGNSALPDDSSGNFTEQEMSTKNLVFEGTLEEGDTLYIPRGFYHSASTGSKHSLHVTVSLCHKVTFTHLLKSVAEDVWDNIRNSRLLARRSLPAHFLEMNGVAPLDYCHDYKTEIMPVVNSLLEDVSEAYKVAIPTAIDRLGAEFMKTALPPMLSENERSLSIHGNDSLTLFGNDEGIEINKNVEIKLIRMHNQRLLYENENTPYIAHRVSNSRIMAENKELHTIPITLKMVDGLKELFSNYPQWTKVKSLKCGVKLARLLYENGLLMVRTS